MEKKYIFSTRLIKLNNPGKGWRGGLVQGKRHWQKRCARWGFLHKTTPVPLLKALPLWEKLLPTPSSKSQEAILISAPSSFFSFFFAKGNVALLVAVVQGMWGRGWWHTRHRTTSTYFPLIKKEAQAANQPATSLDLPWLLLLRSFGSVGWLHGGTV